MLLPRIGDSKDIPIEVALSWVPNYVDPVRRTWLIPYATAFAAFTTSLVFIRLALRIAKKGGGLGIDDAFLTLSYILLALYTAIIIYGCQGGMTDRHVQDINPDVWVLGTKLGWWSTILFSAGTGFLKLSVLFFYRRLIKGTYNRFILAYNSAFVIGLVFTCWPIEAYWMSSDIEYALTADYHCTTWIWGNIISGVFNAMSTLYSVILPALVLWNLQLPRRQKIGLYAIFTLGGVDVIIACVRTKYMWDFATLYDPSWYGYDAEIVSAAEWNVGMICACLPSLRVLFRTFFDDSNARSAYNKGEKGRSNSPRYVRPRSLNRIQSGDSQLPLTSYKGEPQWVRRDLNVEKGIVRTREYAVES